jgi:hypothetical protein
MPSLSPCLVFVSLFGGDRERETAPQELVSNGSVTVCRIVGLGLTVFGRPHTPCIGHQY